MNAEHPYLRLYGMLLSQLLFFALLFSSMLLKERSLLPWCIMALILHGLLLCGLFGCFHRYRARKVENRRIRRRQCVEENYLRSHEATAASLEEIRAEIDGKNTAGCDVVACVPYVDLAVVLEACKGSVSKVGAENVHWEKSGAYTGEISADMLKEIGVEYVIVGHSECRQYFGETDETVNLRVKAALAAGLKVILCVGELLAQREQGITDEVVSLQTKVALQGVGAEALKNVIIAYEPVWAIGTGRTATSEQADEVCGVIRGVVAGLYSDAAADALTVQYGGSMNAKNAAELLAMPNVDGGLIGGASLKAPDFATIIAAAQ